jgi:endonuclease III
MARAEKADRLLTILDGLYPEVAIPLAHSDPFTLLVAVVLSAQPGGYLQRLEIFEDLKPALPLVEACC